MLARKKLESLCLCENKKKCSNFSSICKDLDEKQNQWMKTIVLAIDVNLVVKPKECRKNIMNVISQEFINIQKFCNI